MSRLGQPFFGLTLMSKIDLFWNEIESLCYAYSGMSPWDVYELPVSVRKFFIRSYVKRREEQEGERDDTTKPLTPLEKTRYMQKSQQLSTDPSRFIPKKT
jgi:hypothetical protein